MRTFVPMPEHVSSLVEYDPDRPRIVVHQEHWTVILDDGVDFLRWARERWPEPGGRWS
jgi:hypothetical protein